MTSQTEEAKNSTQRISPGIHLTAFFIIVSIACVIATLFTAFSTNLNLPKNENTSNQIIKAQDTTPDLSITRETNVKTNKTIGILAGHYGYDTGTVCPDGVKEVDITLQVATMVQKNLVDKGFEAQLLKENDDLLPDYKAITLIAIHVDSCEYINSEATGFKVAASTINPYPERPARLAACLRNRYQQVTKLPIHSQSITPDMTDYHVFREINENTTAAIIEIGFLNLDKEFLLNNQETIAEGIVKGIECFINNENIIQPTSETLP